jgi:hypothetical protein
MPKRVKNKLKHIRRLGEARELIHRLECKALRMKAKFTMSEARGRETPQALGVGAMQKEQTKNKRG